MAQQYEPTPAGPEIDRVFSRDRQTERVLAGLCVPVASVGVELAVCHYDDPGKVGGLGLITVTPWPIFALAFVLSLSFATLLRMRSPPTLALLAHVAALAFLLPGLPGLLEQYPRFGTAWLHVGFIQAMIVHQHPIVGLDARFSWPGFFTAIAAVVGMAHLGNALGLIRWTPLILNLAYALPIFVIARALLGSTSRAWLAVWLFILTNWVGQDYFSPQGMGYFILLAVIAVVLVGFHRSDPPIAGKRLRAILVRVGDPARPDSLPLAPLQQFAVLVIGVLAVVALSMEHQLTPVVLGVDVVALVLVRQTSARFFAIAVVVSVIAWISYGAQAFWLGHLSAIFGTGGAQAVQSTVTNRISGSQAHQLVVYERLGFAFAVWFVAGVATLRGYLRRSPVPAAALTLALAPAVVLAAQSYGGEAGLRVYLYTLPFMLIVAVGGLADLFRRAKLSTVLAIGVLSAAIVPLMLVARFGNEQFEQVTAGDVAAARYVYATARPGSSIVSVAPNAILGYRGLAAYQYPPVEPGDFAFTRPSQLLAAINIDPRGTYVLVTPAQVAYAVVNDGMPVNWGAQLVRRLDQSSRFRLLYSRFGGFVYRVEAAGARGSKRHG